MFLCFCGGTDRAALPTRGAVPQAGTVSLWVTIAVGIAAFLREDGVRTAGALSACWCARTLCRAHGNGSEWPHKEPSLSLST